MALLSPLLTRSLSHFVIVISPLPSHTGCGRTELLPNNKLKQTKKINQEISWLVCLAPISFLPFLHTLRSPKQILWRDDLYLEIMIPFIECSEIQTQSIQVCAMQDWNYATRSPSWVTTCSALAGKVFSDRIVQWSLRSGGREEPNIITPSLGLRNS